MCVCATNPANARHFHLSPSSENFPIMQVLFDYKSVEKVIEIRLATATLGRLGNIVYLALYSFVLVLLRISFL